MTGTADLQGNPVPTQDGDVTNITNLEARYTKTTAGARIDNPYFDAARRVVFINGMGNSGSDHVESALQLSLLQMCTVIGVFNRSSGFISDLIQCVGDKNQFQGVSLSASNGLTVRRLIRGETSEQAARAILSRNAAQAALFDVLLPVVTRKWEIFAHSQGNLILSNVLQAIEAVQGAPGIAGRVVHTYGSPAVNWPKGIVKHENGFTFDGVNWLSGIDWSFTISKVGMPADSWNPFTHGFLEYMKRDPAFVVNRFRTGSFGVTLNMDEDGLAETLAAMGANLPRVRQVFVYLRSNHPSDSDDVAVRYVNLIRTRPAVVDALRRDRAMIALLRDILGGGVVFPSERRAIEFLGTL